MMLGRPAWWAVASTMCLVTLLILTNVFAHTVVAVDTAEVDGYFVRADELLQGKPYSDPYRPPLYTVLTAGFSLLLGGNTFLAAKLISAIATGFIISFTYLLARLFVNPQYALLAQFLVAIDDVVIQHGLWAGTDALFTSLSMGTLLSAVADRHRQMWPSIMGSVILGVLFGLTCLTRYIAVFLLPIVVYGLWQNNGFLRLRLIGIAFISAIVVMLPWLVYNTMTNGSPLANENWRNLAFALYGEGDWQYLQDVNFKGYIDIFTRDPLGVLNLWASNIITITMVIPLLHSSSILLGAFLPVGFASLVRDNTYGRLLIIYVAACIAPVVLTFFYTPRLMLPATPILILTAVIGLARVLPTHKFVHKVIVVITAAIILRPVQLPTRVSRFFQIQPLAEVEMLNDLADKVSATSENPLKIVSTYQYLAYFARFPERIQHHWVPYYSKHFPESLPDVALSCNASYILISDRTTCDAIRKGLIDHVLPRYWVLEREKIVPAGTIRLYKCTNVGTQDGHAARS